jgi:hypothetical protein
VPIYDDFVQILLYFCLLHDQFTHELYHSWQVGYTLFLRVKARCFLLDIKFIVWNLYDVLNNLEESLDLYVTHVVFVPNDAIERGEDRFLNALSLILFLQRFILILVRSLIITKTIPKIFNKGHCCSLEMVKQSSLFLVKIMMRLVIKFFKLHNLFL